MDIIYWLLVIVQFYVAVYAFIILHELGHVPERIKMKWGLIPNAVAVRAKYRLGGLIINVLVFSLVFYFKPEILILQLVGLIAWAHFIIYSILGSVIPEPKPSQVNTNTYVFDDVPNEYAAWFISAALIVLFLMKDYYFNIVMGVFL